ncbi:MAG: hypothetical protein PG981_000562 [Wolbachia endosymbiont of Ctenocephalides orientis wCori]|nr:MAG: hypothetical protein PG981_000562 [Wolbachia endosymbiont of Ctenocephalides orientis wCori]
MNKENCFKIDKLVRDHTPEIMRSHGMVVYYRIMEKDEYVERLKNKLLEEAKEVIASKTPDETLEELADLVEVIHALGKESGLSIEQIEEKRISKRQEIGSFDNRIYIDYYLIKDS